MFCHAYTQEIKKAEPPRERAVIYNFKIKNQIKNRDFEYYTVIIPQAIAKTLQKSNKLTVMRIPDRLDASLEGDSKENIKLIKDLAKKYTADYIITGSCGLVEGKLVVDIHINNVKGKNSADINKVSEETGALLKDTIDDLASVVEFKIAKFQKEKRLDYEPSPVIGFYNIIKDTTFGIDIGKYYLKGGWSDILNDGYYIRPNILFNSRGTVGISANLDYFSTGNKGKYAFANSSLQFFGTTGSINWMPKFSNYFSMSIAPGFGAAFSKIDIKSASDLTPFRRNLARAKSTDPYLDVTAGIIMNISNIQLKFGSSYKRAFMKGKDLEMYTVSAGLGYTI
jgi:hypothetical protein